MAICTICAASAFGQNSVSTSSGSNGSSGTARFSAPPEFAARPVIGAPYSGEEIGQHIGIRADGTQVTLTVAPTKFYRDSSGRMRSERVLDGTIPGSPVAIEITDPVAHVKYTLDTINKVAHRQQLARKLITRVETSDTGAVPRTITEKLGHRTIDGVLTVGTRLTTIWPVNTRGNDRPISAVRETWTSPGLQLTIMGKSADPLTGEDTWRLTNVSLGEPPASLFKPPREYAVVDEAGEFTIAWDAPK
jgi:hypothetical protein